MDLTYSSVSLKYGLKLYMNDKNPLESWLTKNGITVSSVTDLENDIKHQNIILSEREKVENLRAFNKLFLSFTKNDFCNQVYLILK